MSTPAELLQVAARVVWFKPADVALEDPIFFLAHVMTYGTIEDILSAKKYFTDADFRRVLDEAPAGVFDKRSWAYWNTVFNRLPVPPLPKRKFLAHQGTERA
jgi:hypothetical protein